jgi:hypothetical protein
MTTFIPTSNKTSIIEEDTIASWINSVNNSKSRKNYNVLKRFFKIYLNGFEGAAHWRDRFMQAHQYNEALELLNIMHQEMSLQEKRPFSAIENRTFVRLYSRKHKYKIKYLQ